MQVFIMRHGDAQLEAASDAQRPLTARGRDESRLMACWLSTKINAAERVLVSPYVRAQQTLDVLREKLLLPNDVESLPELTPGGDAEKVNAYLQELAITGVASVIIVSHLPLVGYLVGDICCDEQAPMFATSAVACINVDSTGGPGKLEWLVTPAQLLVKA